MASSPTVASGTAHHRWRRLGALPPEPPAVTMSDCVSITEVTTAAGWIAGRRLAVRGEIGEEETSALPQQEAPPEVSSPRSSAELRAEVDRVLDKISARGLGALTPDERRILDEAKRVGIDVVVSGPGDSPVTSTPHIRRFQLLIEVLATTYYAMPPTLTARTRTPLTSVRRRIAEYLIRNEE